MWFHLGFQNYLAKTKLDGDDCVILVTDLRRIWHKSLSSTELFSIIQSLNPLLEGSISKLRDITLRSLADENVQKEIKEENTKISLKLESDIMGVKFRFQVCLNEGDNEMFYEEFTIPLLLILLNTQNRENKLIKIINDKDAEIKEYKQECGSIKSGFMMSKPFNKTEFDSENLYPCDISPFLDFVNSRLIAKEKEESEEKSSSLINCDIKKLIFKDRNIIDKTGSKPCVSFDNQTVKKRRKHNNFKINL